MEYKIFKHSADWTMLNYITSFSDRAQAVDFVKTQPVDEVPYYEIYPERIEKDTGKKITY